MQIVLKIGGTLAEEGATMDALLSDLGTYRGSLVLVHGGGSAVTRLSQRLGIEPQFIDGVRTTSPAEMELADMVLGGRVNKELVRRSGREGIPAIGLSGADGNLLTGRLVNPHGDNRTATVESVNLEVLRIILAGGLLPIVASVGTGTDGNGVNINADEAARALAVAFATEGEDVTLCFLSDIPGVKSNSGTVIGEIKTSQVEPLVADGTVQGGMIAKLRSSAEAIRAGLDRVVIGGYRRKGDVRRLLDGNTGTTIHT